MSMNHPSRRPYGDLPPHVRHDPAVVHWRLEIIERRLEALEARWHLSLPSLEKWPWVQILSLLAVAILAISGHISQADVLSMAKRLSGL